MNVDEARGHYYEFTGKLSDVTRQLAFAGIALVWIFGLGQDTTARLPQALVWPLLALVVCLSFDVLQYAVSTASWGIFARMKEKQEDEAFEAPPWINWVPILFIIGKVAALGVAYIMLGVYIADRLT